jgi:hypothetical protein
LHQELLKNNKNDLMEVNFMMGRTFWLIWQKLFKLVGNFAPRQVPPQCHKCVQFRYEDGFKINNKYFPAISRTQYFSTETISRPLQFHETIPLSPFPMCPTKERLKSGFPVGRTHFAKKGGHEFV